MFLRFAEKRGRAEARPLLGLCGFAKNNGSLLQELEHALGNLVRLSQHGLGGLDQDVVLGVGHHFLGHVHVADGGLGVLD